MSDAVRIKRGFADLPHGQMHYRYGGEGEAFLALHASPGGSRQMHGFIRDFADQYRVITPDTAGNGDSEPLSDQEPTLVDLAKAVVATMDELGLEKVKLYGSHTGAGIATEVCILAPERISHVVLDGLDMRGPELLAETLANYAFPFSPDLDGVYMTRIFQFCRDQFLFYPWYKRTKEAQRIGGLPPASELHGLIMEVMKGCESYHLNYRAAFKWKAKERLPLLQVPALLTSAINDPLYDITKELLDSVPNGRFAEFPRFDAPDYAAVRKSIISAFLADPAPKA